MTRIGTALLAVGLAALAGCDRMVDTGYEGESLLQLRGSVAIPLELQGVTYEPAITWRAASAAGGGYPHLRITPVDVSGDFPGSFTLDVFDPPPSEALFHDVESEPALAYGVITAITPYYPAAVSVTSILNGCGEFCHKYAVCEGTDARMNAGPDADLSACYQQDVYCGPDLHPNGEGGCELRGSGGNDALAFGGASEDLRILYFTAPIARDTLLADRYNDGEALAAGYHVFKLAPFPPSVIEDAADWVPTEREQCERQSFPIALERYNAAHGTSFTGEPDSPHPTGKDLEELDRTVLRVKRELGCERPDRGYIPVDPATDPIAIQLGMLDLVAAGL